MGNSVSSTTASETNIRIHGAPGSSRRESPVSSRDSISFRRRFSRDLFRDGNPEIELTIRQRRRAPRRNEIILHSLGRLIVEARRNREGLDTGEPWDEQRVESLIEAKLLAPRSQGLDEPFGENLEECPICFCFYPRVNRSSCCSKPICTNCFLYIQRKTRKKCPYCNKGRLDVYLPNRNNSTDLCCGESEDWVAEKENISLCTHRGKYSDSVGGNSSRKLSVDSQEASSRKQSCTVDRVAAANRPDIINREEAVSDKNCLHFLDFPDWIEMPDGNFIPLSVLSKNYCYVPYKTKSEECSQNHLEHKLESEDTCRLLEDTEELSHVNVNGDEAKEVSLDSLAFATNSISCASLPYPSFARTASTSEQYAGASEDNDKEKNSAEGQLLPIDNEEEMDTFIQLFSLENNVKNSADNDNLIKWPSED